MNDNRRQALGDVLVFALLVAIGVAGRWGQPEWCFTPTAAAAIFAGRYFSRLTVAAMVPLAILAISDLLLPAYDNLAVMVATYGVMTFPVALGKWLGVGAASRWGTALRWATCGLVPATAFFLVSNFAVWAFQSNYEKSWAGLVAGYGMAVPLFRWMLAGGLFYLAILFACGALAGLPLPQSSP